MASWATLGALEGLGQSVAGMGEQYVKSKIADDIEQRREARSEERLKAKEARDEARKLTTPVRENAMTRRNPTTGAWEIQDANYLNQPLGSSRPLDEWSAAQRDTQEKKDKIATENATLTGQLTKFKLDRAPIEAAQSDREFEADMGYKGALTNAANARATKALDGSDDDEGDTFDGEAQSLVKKYSTLLGTGDDAFPATDAHSLAQEAIEYAIQTNGDASTAENYFLNAIKNKAKPSKTRVKFVQ